MAQSLTNFSCCKNIHQAWEDTPAHGTEARGYEGILPPALPAFKNNRCGEEAFAREKKYMYLAIIIT